MAGTLQKRKLDFRRLDDLIDEVDRLEKAGYDRAGTWSLTQNCEHIGKIILYCLDGKPGQVRSQLPWFIKMGGKLSFVMMQKIRMIPMRVEAPDLYRPRADGQDDGAAIESFRETVRKLRDHNGPLTPHPAFGPLSKDEWIDFHCIHGGHHIGHLLPRG